MEQYSQTRDIRAGRRNLQILSAGGDIDRIPDLRNGFHGGWVQRRLSGKLCRPDFHGKNNIHLYLKV